jgi:ATP-dependent DNA ligase
MAHRVISLRKHDGFRLMVRREGSRVRLWTRGGYDWADRFPRIVEAASRLRTSSFLIEARPSFAATRGRHNDGPRFTISLKRST